MERVSTFIVKHQFYTQRKQRSNAPLLPFPFNLALEILADDYSRKEVKDGEEKKIEVSIFLDDMLYS